MKLSKCDFYLDWPKSIDTKSLRRFITDNLVKKGDVIRWSITEIKSSNDSFNSKKLKISATLAI